MASYNKINQFVEDIVKGVHNLTSGVTGALTYALTTTANKPLATNATLSALTQISYTNLSTRVAGFTSCAQTSGTLKLILPDLVLTASGTVAAFGAVVLYNDTPTSPADPLISWWEYGSDVTLLNTETFTIDLDQSGGCSRSHKGTAMPVMKFSAPDLGFGFSWEPESRNLFIIHANGAPHEQIAANVMTPEVAEMLRRHVVQGLPFPRPRDRPQAGIEALSHAG
jgi:hypothetical protein